MQRGGRSFPPLFFIVPVLEWLKRTFSEGEESMTTYVFKATLEEEDDGRWSAWIDVLPGAAAWGYTREEALEVLQDIAELCVEEMLECGDPIPSEETESINNPTVVVAA